MAFVAVAAKSFSQQLQIKLRGPPVHREAPISRGMDLVTVTTQVEVMVGVGVPSNTATVALTQKVTAELSSLGHVGDVRTKAVV